jgi:hypothetical protein
MMITPAYRLSCEPFKGLSGRITEIGFNPDFEAGFREYQAAVKARYPDAHGFMIESDQGDAAIRKSWGLCERA